MWLAFKICLCNVTCNVTHFLKNGSIKVFVYYFVGNFKLLHESVKRFHNFHRVRRYHLSEVTKVPCRVYSILALDINLFPCSSPSCIFVNRNFWNIQRIKWKNWKPSSNERIRFVPVFSFLSQLEWKLAQLVKCGVGNARARVSESCDGTKKYFAWRGKKSNLPY